MSIDLVPKGAGSAIITQAAESGNFITVSTAPLFPLSRGYSHINSTDVSAKPTIDPRYMMHPPDVEVLARLVGYIDTITKTEPFSKLLKPGGRRSYGAPDDLTNLEQVKVEQVKAYIMTSTLSCWHPTSACALLREVALWTHNCKCTALMGSALWIQVPFRFRQEETPKQRFTPLRREQRI